MDALVSRLFAASRQASFYDHSMPQGSSDLLFIAIL